MYLPQQTEFWAKWSFMKVCPVLEVPTLREAQAEDRRERRNESPVPARIRALLLTPDTL